MFPTGFCAKTNGVRFWELAALAAVVGAALLTSPGPLRAGGHGGAEDPVLGRVNGHEIRLSDVYAQVESLSLGDQIDVRGQIARFTESVLTEEILFQFAMATDFAGEAELRKEIKGIVVERLLRKHVRDRIVVSEEDIRQYYRENRDYVRGLHVRVRQIVLRSRAECERVLRRIETEDDFARFAREMSRHRASAEAGGDMGYLMPVRSQDWVGFEMELFKMSLGEMRVFESSQGCHLVRITDVLSPPDPPMAEVRTFVRPILERQLEQKLLQGLIDKASRKVHVERLAATGE